MRKEDYVSSEAAKILKEKGFEGYCYGCYYKEKFWEIKCWNQADMFEGEFYAAPTLYDIQKWLRKNYNIHITIGNSASGYWWELSKADNGTTIYDYNYSGPNDGGKWDCYEDALDSVILTVLNSKLIKKTKQK